ncbi:OmpA/MotB family protein [Imtechella halotolerans]|uniref:OmpA-like domain-containing protein n=1 Tax=Imtechella halotolerans K1 TaxID=946077 RepID=I0WJY7_9FLAO|nr:OmpA family protein [Imtechella halotolerans]EID76703.1 hypothetical protein W5A_01730 [Imtechella halotolerans K1]WMQ62729.1 OmpA family protein [Imtechella halotolerans]
MKRLLVSGAMLTLLMSSCVSSKVYKDLESRYAALKEERNQLVDSNENLLADKNELSNQLDALNAEYSKAIAERDRLKQDLVAMEANIRNLQMSYDALEKNSNAALTDNAKKNRELLEQLEKENNRLNELRQQLDARSRRVDELEHLIASKDAAMKNLKDALSKALLDFEGKGLTIEQRDGKVYVSMENKLLFNSGSWAVGVEGRKAVQQLGQVLSQNPDINVLIEGHTDDVPYKSSGTINDNWDLSTKRATAIVQILVENRQINPNNLTAAGRGEYAPISTNSTADGKARNRRIEVILTPKLDEVSKLLNQI